MKELLFNQADSSPKRFLENHNREVFAIQKCWWIAYPIPRQREWMKSADVFFCEAMLFMPIRMTSSYMYDGVACSKPALVGIRYGSYRSGDGAVIQKDQNTRKRKLKRTNFSISRYV